MSSDDSSILDKLDSAAAPLAQFDAFPKIPSAYKARSESRGFMTVFVALLALLLMLNDISEYIYGWPDQEFSIDNNKFNWMGINVDITVNMPCRFLSVDLRDAMGDRLFLSGGLRRDGTKFDTTQATTFKAHTDALSVRQVVAQSRKSRGLFSFFQRQKPLFPPTYKHEEAADACRVWGTLGVKRVTANLHITTLGHGYASYEHVDHNQMNLSHVISEFSFGPHFPDIAQPLDYSYEVTHDPFVAYQYYLNVVPTTYIAPRSQPVQTNQYSVTHYTRVLEHNRGTPGIFFKFDLDPLALTIHQRTPTLLALIIRCVGVLGGVFVCAGYAIKITTRAVEVVSGADSAPGIVAAESSSVKVGLRQKWGGGELRARGGAGGGLGSGKMVPQGAGWVLEGDSPYASYAGSAFAPGTPHSPYMHSGGVPLTPAGIPIPPTPNVALGFAPGTPSFGPHTPLTSAPGSPYINGNGHGSNGNGNGYTNGNGSGMRTPGTPGVGYAAYPSSPAPGASGFAVGPPPRRTPSIGLGSNLGRKDD
ncbi:hypothetical protein H0H81_002596 [Sphagnurus paluster]|uniref:DUF1692-domain-containing protein n=1 Tax=Sphagnurus paluster TaxID=117069 RepID=A0A9P7GMJ5_9AGAR|nr:hypothetical protein H0H81_002596 [Sphagnurus paluster]